MPEEKKDEAQAGPRNRLKEELKPEERTYARLMSRALELLEEGTLNLEEVRLLIIAEEYHCENIQTRARQEMEAYSRQPDQAFEAGVKWLAFSARRRELRLALDETDETQAGQKRNLQAYLKGLDAQFSYYQEGAHSGEGKTRIGQARENMEATIRVLCPPSSTI